MGLSAECDGSGMGLESGRCTDILTLWFTNVQFRASDSMSQFLHLKSGDVIILPKMAEK